VNGIVDNANRALLEISISANAKAVKELITTWIDTAFNGGLVIPRTEIERLRLKKASIIEAILADGTTVELETFACYIDWFGAAYKTQVVANDGEYPLLGTTLLANRVLCVDYRAKTLTLE